MADVLGLRFSRLHRWTRWALLGAIVGYWLLLLPVWLWQTKRNWAEAEREGRVVEVGNVTEVTIVVTRFWFVMPLAVLLLPPAFLVTAWIMARKRAQLSETR
jgi:hypothetical protein